jgi:lipopolysaccharide transport system permease protein
MVFAGLLPWFLFSTILSEASNSLVGNANLVGKVYFPRLIIPASSAVVALVDFAINLAILFGLMVWYGFWPSWHIALLLAFVALAMLASLGPAFLITALNVKYRDFRYIIPFIVQFGLYISPVRFSSAIVPEGWRFWYSLNPMVGVIDGFRGACSAAKAGSTLLGSYSASALSLCSCGSASPISGPPNAALPI